MEIKILGTGCARCKTLEKLTRDAVAETGVTADIEKVEDIVKIMAYGVMNTPALVINQKSSTERTNSIDNRNQGNIG